MTYGAENRKFSPTFISYHQAFLFGLNALMEIKRRNNMNEVGIALPRVEYVVPEMLGQFSMPSLLPAAVCGEYLH